MDRVRGVRSAAPPHYLQVICVTHVKTVLCYSIYVNSAAKSQPHQNEHTKRHVHQSGTTPKQHATSAMVFRPMVQCPHGSWQTLMALLLL